jgi:hypothetical protein
MQSTQGPLFNALSREAGFCFVLSVQLTTFGFALLCAFARGTVFTF